MADPCNFCHGSRLVGWSGAGPILCPECSRGKDAFTVITQAWREQRARVRELEDCGQNGVCALSPGCIRHWQERNRELVTERDQQTLRANRSEAGERDELRAEVERLRDVLATQDAQHATDRQLLKAELAELAKLREERRWVPISQPPGPGKDPDYSVDVLVLFSSGCCRVGFVEQEGGAWLYHDNDAPWDETATHWMPLPAPPGEKGE